MVARQWLRAGDEVVVVNPVDFVLAHVAESVGAIPVRWPVTRFGELDLNRLAELVSLWTKAIFVWSPHNPLVGLIPLNLWHGHRHRRPWSV